MNIILLSGGSGKRLWPISNSIRSKQFIKVFRDDEGNRQSMIQRTVGQIRTVDKAAKITIATAKAQISSLCNQLKGEASLDICAEPCRKDTFPAIALAAAYLHDVKKMDGREAVVVCSVDSYVELPYFHMLKKLEERAGEGTANLVLMGIEPTYPSEKYGYIMPKNIDAVSPVRLFKEKPDQRTAEQYIKQGALWNGGVFAFKLDYLLGKAHELIDFMDYEDLYRKYDTLDKISFDYAVVERERSIEVMRYQGEWKDLGTWNTLTDVMDEVAIGNVAMDDTCENAYVINELDVPILCMGLKNMVVSASAEGILVTDKFRSSYMKPYVEKFSNDVHYAEKSWGEYRVIDVQDGSMTVRVTLSQGSMMNYHSHERRDEIWNVILGEGRVIVDGMEQRIKAGDVVTMQAGCKHTVIAKTELKLIEVQIGNDITVHDKKKHELDV